MSKKQSGGENDGVTRKRDSSVYGEPIDTLSHSVVEIDRQGNIAFANRAAYQAFGYDHGGLVSFSALLLLAPEDREKVQAEINHRFDVEGTSCVQYTAQRKDGSRFPVVLYFSPILRGGKTVRLRTFWLTLQSE
jgi:PAS domain S-box-containing protein